MMTSRRNTPDDCITFLRRLDILRSWTSSFPAERLAQAGFVCSEVAHVVICPFCDVEGYNWCESDGPIADHMEWPPDGPFWKSIFLYSRIKTGLIKEIKTKIILQNQLKMFTEWTIAIEQKPQSLGEGLFLYRPWRYSMFSLWY